MNKSIYKQKFIALFLLSAFVFGSLPSSAQKLTGGKTVSNNQTVASNQKKDDKKECNSGYSGTVTYTKTLNSSYTDPKTGSSGTRKKVFTVNIPIRDDGRQTGRAVMSPDGKVNGSFNFKARATATLSDGEVQTQKSEGKQVCSFNIKGAKESYRSCTSTTNRQGQATGEGEVTVFLGLQGDKLQISSDVPRIAGQTNETHNSNCTGGCETKQPINTARTISINEKDKGFYTDDGAVTFNPRSFNRLSGSFTRTMGDTVEVISWNLSRCSPPLEIGDIRFEHRKVPNPDRWFGIDPKSGTVDGNIVKVKAKIYNNGGDTAYANVKFSETKLGEALPDGTVSVMVKAGEARDVEYEWDTSGFAWNKSQKNESEREIKAELEGGNTETAKIKIKPKPVVLVHGLWANADGWANYPIFLRNAHSYDWNGYAVGADPENGKMSTGDYFGNWRPTNTIFQNSQQIGKQIKYVREKENAWHVDIVAHSMGGLISRHYINTFMLPVYDGKPEAAHLIMLGTPNQGSPCANLVDGLFGMFGNNEMLAMKELRPVTVAKFNSINTNRKGVKFSILAGYTVRTTCHEPGLGDGVVQLPSAFYNISDRDYSRNVHTELTSKADFERFVLPRLAVGPKKARADRQTAQIESEMNDIYMGISSENSSADRYGFNSYFQKASFKRDAENAEEDEIETLTTRQKVVLKGKETKEVEIPVRDGLSAGILIVAATAVSATLFDETGALVGKSVFDSPTAPRDLFRVINADRQIRNGVWRLKLENFDANEQIVYLAGWTNNGASSAFTVETGKPSAAGIVPLTAKLTENNAPVLNAKITGKIVGQTSEIVFFDDGKHADGAAGDGVYGAATDKLTRGEYFVEAKAEANNQTKIAVAPVKTATKTRR